MQQKKVDRHVAFAIGAQEALGLDVLVHGEVREGERERCVGGCSGAVASRRRVLLAARAVRGSTPTSHANTNTNATHTNTKKQKNPPPQKSKAERTDMVEYFGERLEGMAFTTHGWVQV